MTDAQETRILLVNDDGIDAPGIRLLERLVASRFDDVWVVAPDDERSGASHAISVTVPARLRKRDDRHFAVLGTPTDCVLLARYEVMNDGPPGLVLSGINRGANLAEDAIYSGTIAAAIEGSLLGMRAIALSQIVSLEPGSPTRWETAERFLLPVVEFLMSRPWPEGLFYNVNFPDVPPEEVSGVRVTAQGRRAPGAFMPISGIDGRNVPYYWIKLTYPDSELLPGTDLEAIAHKAVSITPMQLDLTDHARIDALSRALAREKIA